MMVTTIDPRARALRDALRRLLVAHGVLDKVERPCGTPLTTSHAWTLLELRERGAMTVTALAEHLNIDRTNVSRLCTRMASLGELERSPHPGDARARLVQLTRKGEHLADMIDASSTDHFAGVLDRLDTDVESLIHTLDALTHALGERRTPEDGS